MKIVGFSLAETESGCVTARVTIHVFTLREVPMSAPVTFTVTGDSFMTRRLPTPHDASFREVAQFIQQAPSRFTNLETVIRRDEGFPFAFSGGTWATSPPEVLEDLKSYGFNALNCATNHTIDFSYGGLEATQRYLNDAGLLHFGVGHNLAQASAPRYQELPGARVAWIGATFTFHETWRAGAQRPEIVGRPGINPVRVQKTYFASRQEIATLRKLASNTSINDIHNLRVKEGFVTPDAPDSFRFNDLLFKVSSPTRMEARVASIDRDRILAAIDEARRQADLVLVSLHCHDMKNGNKSLPPDYLVQFAHDCIDAGASGIIGHGPHVLRAIEIYQHKPIFYSLGNFIFQPDTVPHQPADFYEKYNLDPKGNIADALDQQTKNGTIGLSTNPHVWQSVIAHWSMTQGNLDAITLRPITLGFGLPRYTQGWPQFASPEEGRTILSELAELSKPFGTELTIDDNTGHIRARNPRRATR